jgi:hypothetical protein
VPVLPRLEAARCAILAGAGVSVASGIATGQMFNPRVLARVGAPRDAPVRFEQLIAVLRDFADPALSILDYLEASWQPSALHAWLARQIAGGAHVLTTNLDSLIELAFRDAYGRLPAQIVDAADWTSCLLGTPPDALFKLHGTLRRTDFLAGDRAAPRALDTAAVTLDAIGSLRPSPSALNGGFLLPETTMRALELLLDGRDLVVAGYSGSDDFDIMPSLWKLRPLCRGIIWIAHHDDRPRVRRFRDLLLIRGRTDDVVEALFGELPRGASLAASAGARLDAFLDRWSDAVALRGVKQRTIEGEILRQCGRVIDAVRTWRDLLRELPQTDLAGRARLHLLAANASVSGQLATWAAEHAGAAVEAYDALHDRVGRAEARVGHAAAAYDLSLLRGASPDPAVNELAAVMPRLREAQRDGENALYLMRWPEEERIARAGEQRRIETMLMRGALTLARIARHNHAVQSAELVRDVAGHHAPVTAWLPELARHSAVPADKPLYADYLAELSLDLLAAGDEAGFAQRDRELRALARLLGLHFRMGLYDLDLAAMAEAPAAAALYARAKRAFRLARHQPGAILAARNEAELRGASPEDAELWIRFAMTEVE